ncbi:MULTISPECIES: Holliday junction branch migration protein RuvA [Thiomicrorhabdus]|uniref:Holliday junction branch migration complex subunit RuvA n=1 Tax=Thiomicrorhabdus heinhorstiae TaxID=2748010 RepID=A0ABS0BYF8_9GAMM|nr:MULTISPECIES: Holliday junction branch migration protein RuvA [Thiomicrorhabdus]MBF6058034.1 Holliday junction branch migration protein RuvA [Thiomicrorhabdus heinhorstiae]
MIGFLRGRIVERQPPMLWLDVQGVGYEIEAPMSTFYRLESQDNEVHLLIHMHVREDAMLLFGFATREERLLFKTLLKVNGVGAKMALAILSAMSVEDFCVSVDHGDIKALTRIPGVGKKTAERLQMEMKDRLKPMLDEGQFGLIADSVSGSAGSTGTSGSASIPASVKNSAVEALMSLGYKAAEAEKLVTAVYQEEMSLEQLIKSALQGVKL